MKGGEWYNEIFLFWPCRVVRPSRSSRVSASNGFDTSSSPDASLLHDLSVCGAKNSTGGTKALEIPLGENIRRLRIKNNMTQRELAWHLQVSVQAVSKWETAKGYPDLSLVLAIAELFSVSLDELFGREVTIRTWSEKKKACRFMRQAFDFLKIIREKHWKIRSYVIELR